MNGRGRGGGDSHGLTHPRKILFCDRVPGLGGEGLIKSYPITKGMVYLILLFICTIKSEQKWSDIIKCTSFYNTNQYKNTEHTAFLKIILGWKAISPRPAPGRRGARSPGPHWYDVWSETLGELPGWSDAGDYRFLSLIPRHWPTEEAGNDITLFPETMLFSSIFLTAQTKHGRKCHSSGFFPH